MMGVSDKNGDGRPAAMRSASDENSNGRLLLWALAWAIALFLALCPRWAQARNDDFAMRRVSDENSSGCIEQGLPDDFEEHAAQTEWGAQDEGDAAETE